MRHDERFDAFFSRRGKLDRLPIIEWAGWWDKTTDQWKKQGMSPDVNPSRYWDLDPLVQFWIGPRTADCPVEPSFGAGIMQDEADYEKLKKYLYKDESIENAERTLKEFAENRGDRPCWFTLDGFFWFPRTLFGIEGHLYAFYDEPELMMRINRDLCDFYKRCLEMVFKHIRPCFMTFAEDMSYNHGPMCSREMYNKFILPFYKELTPIIQAHGTKVVIDTDGFVEPMIPWYLEGGIQGILPLERMAGVDVNRICENFPDLFMIGGYDKTVMHKGEEAMRAEFERILPAIRSGRYIPAVDHQTPPDVSMENYAIYRRLLGEYALQGAREE